MDISRYLPLSWRERHDESDVSNDWSASTVEVLLDLAAAIDQLSLHQWSGASLRPAMSVAGEIAVAISELHPRGDRDVEAFDRAQASAELRRLAGEITGSTRPTRIGALTAAVVAAFDLSAATGVPIVVASRSSGAVAVARAARAPLGIRSILRDHRFVALDAEWNVGAGQNVASTANEIVLFLFDRRGMPIVTS